MIGKVAFFGILMFIMQPELKVTGKLRPSLTALRAVETAARRRSFTLAADELCVTHSAISHQIRQLETLLGMNLFGRVGLEMVPTPICVELTARLRQGLSDIDLALDEARNSTNPLRQRLQLSVMSDFANAWLIPRMSEFSRAHSDIDLSLRVHTEVTPPDPNSADVGIWHRHIEAKGFRSICLLQDRVIAVCSQGFHAKHSPLSTSALPHVPLLRFETRSWHEFFQAADLMDEEPQQGPIFSDAASLLNAALAGQGVAMLRERLVRPYMRSGALVKVGHTQIQANLDYYLVWREGSPRERAILRFADWLRHQVDEP